MYAGGVGLARVQGGLALHARFDCVFMSVRACLYVVEWYVVVCLSVNG